MLRMTEVPPLKDLQKKLLVALCHKDPPAAGKCFKLL